MKRLMIAAMASNSGKTVLTCGLLAAFRARGLTAECFKCGPDYIDPMFHTRVLGIPSRNLDVFLQGEKGVKDTLARQQADIALVEGAMGFYDGLSGTDTASAWQVAMLTETPVVLAVRPGGSSLSLAAQLNGMVHFRPNSPIVGVVLTDCKPMLYAHLKPIIESNTPLRVLGYLPPMTEAELPSRHLGLYTAGEIDDLNARFAAVAAQLEKTASLDELLALAAETAPSAEHTALLAPVCTVAVAQDEAFCFYYQDSLDALEKAGARLVYFSPIRDASLPKADALYLGGGYPELYAEALSRNAAMRTAVADAVSRGMPTVAECGGFLYLQRLLSDPEGRQWPMAGVLPGKGVKTNRLQRFGYLCLTAENDSLLFRAGEAVPAHEFHYWDTDANGADLAAVKPNGKNWRCGFARKTLYAAFPHLHLAGETPLAERFVQAAITYKKEKR